MRRHSYSAAERFLLSREFFGMKLGLENITEFLESIGRPQDNYKTIHLAGTNGKGSCASMLASVLREQGYKTGLFTSPHLVSLRERVRVNGRLIPQRSLVSFVDRHRKELTRRKLSFFEVVTAMALVHFSRVGVDIAVIETGLGGRLDATNVLIPELTMTTDISRDHLEILGTTIQKIAYEKAGIVKREVPHLIAILPAAAERVMEDKCRKVGAPLYRLRPADFVASVEKNSLDFHDNGWSLARVRPGLAGPHQLRNAALVLKATAILRARGMRISKRAIRKGMAGVQWAGRFQVIRKRGKPTIIFDVGHNVGGVETFVQTFQARYPGQRVKILTGFVKRKEHQKMFDLLSKIADRYMIVPLATKRSMDLDELCETINWRGVPMRRFGSMSSGWRHLEKTTGPDEVVAVLGSHYLVGEFFEKVGIK